MSVIALERALEQYVKSGQFDSPFDIKSVPISTESLLVPETRKPLSVEIARTEEKKISRLDIYAGTRKFIILSSQLFKLFIVRIMYHFTYFFLITLIISKAFSIGL